MSGCVGPAQLSDDVAIPSAPPSSVPTTPAVNVRYSSVYDLRDRAERAGVTCAGWDVVASPTRAIERAVCTDQLTFAIHTDASQVAESVENIAQVTNELLGQRSVVLVGPNWSVNCSDDVTACEQLHGILGGEVETREP